MKETDELMLKWYSAFMKKDGRLEATLTGGAVYDAAFPDRTLGVDYCQYWDYKTNPYPYSDKKRVIFAYLHIYLKFTPVIEFPDINYLRAWFEYELDKMK